MQFSFFCLLVLVCLVSYAEAGKPKPKPKLRNGYKNQGTMAPTFTAKGTASASVVSDDNIDDTDFVDDDYYLFFSADVDVVSSTQVGSAGIVAVLGGVAIACVVAIVAIVRAPVREHEPLPDSSETALK